VYMDKRPHVSRRGARESGLVLRSVPGDVALPAKGGARVNVQQLCPLENVT